MSSVSTSTEAPAASVMPQGLVVLVLSLLMGLQPVTTDLYLPALPAMTEGFGASMAQAQLTLSALLLAFGCSQLLWGPLSDRLGRRPLLIAGLVAYTVAAAGCTLSESIGQLIVWRTLQGAAMGACVMGARAVVRDLYHPVVGARVMSKCLSGLGVIACLSAPMGGLLSDLLGWRAAMAALGVFGAATLLIVGWRFEETLTQRNPRALHPRVLWHTWRDILSHRTFLTFTALTAASYGGLFTFLATSSFVFIRVLGLGKTAYGLLMFSMSAAYIGGTFLCRWMLPRWGLRRSVALAGVLSLVGGTTMGVLALAGVNSIWALMLPYYVFMVGHGVHQPCGQSGAVGPFPQSAGAASALNGFGMMLVAFAIGGWLGHHMDGTTLPLALGVWFWASIIALVAWTLVQKYGEPPAH